MKLWLRTKIVYSNFGFATTTRYFFPQNYNIRLTNMFKNCMAQLAHATYSGQIAVADQTYCTFKFEARRDRHQFARPITETFSRFELARPSCEARLYVETTGIEIHINMYLHKKFQNIIYM